MIEANVLVAIFGLQIALAMLFVTALALVFKIYTWNVERNSSK